MKNEISKHDQQLLAVTFYFSYGHLNSNRKEFPSRIVSLVFIGQDMVNSYFLHQVDLHALRQDPTKSLFNLTDCFGADCALALEQNHVWVMELCATLAGADPWPPHKTFKAGLRHGKRIATCFNLAIFFQFKWWLLHDVSPFRESSTRRPCCMGSLVRERQRRPSRRLSASQRCVCNILIHLYELS